jgi:hypothetical protein
VIHDHCRNILSLKAARQCNFARSESQIGGDQITDDAIPCPRRISWRQRSDRCSAAAARKYGLTKSRRSSARGSRRSEPTESSDLNGGVYRASHIALYSSFTRAEPPTRALTNE